MPVGGEVVAPASAPPGTNSGGTIAELTSSASTIAITDGTGPDTNIDIPGNVVGSSASTGTVRIPGLSGSADIRPGSPSSFNDEFDEDGSGIPTGWTALPFGALSVNNTDDFISHLHLKTSLTTAFMSGIYKAAPALTYTVTAKITDGCLATDFDACGMFVSAVVPGSAGSMYGFQFAGGSATALQTMIYNAATGATGSGINTFGTGLRPPMYLRMVVAAATITYLCSYNGQVFQQVAQTTGLALATTQIGLHVTSNGAASPSFGEETVDWIRFM